MGNLSFDITVFWCRQQIGKGYFNCNCSFAREFCWFANELLLLVMMMMMGEWVNEYTIYSEWTNRWRGDAMQCLLSCSNNIIVTGPTYNTDWTGLHCTDDARSPSTALGQSWCGDVGRWLWWWWWKSTNLFKLTIIIFQFLSFCRTNNRSHSNSIDSVSEEDEKNLQASLALMVVGSWRSAREMKSLKVKLSLLNLCTVVISSLKDVIASKPICNATYLSPRGGHSEPCTALEAVPPSPHLCGCTETTTTTSPPWPGQPARSYSVAVSLSIRPWEYSASQAVAMAVLTSAGRGLVKLFLGCCCWKALPWMTTTRQGTICR